MHCSWKTPSLSERSPPLCCDDVGKVQHVKLCVLVMVFVIRSNAIMCSFIHTWMVIKVLYVGCMLGYGVIIHRGVLCGVKAALCGWRELRLS